MKKLLLFFVLFLLAGSTVNAAGIPTVDVVANTLNMSELAESIQHTANQIEQITNQVQQITQLDRQFAAITGSYDMGKLLNGSYQRQIRRFMPNNWFEVKQLCKKAGIPTNLAEAVAAAKKAQEEGEYYPTNEVYRMTDQNAAIRYENEGDRIYATMGLSQTAFNRTEQHIDDLETISERIDSANDLKAAIDLGNRIDTENALLTTELIRQTSILNLQEAERREEMRNKLGAEMAKCDMTIPSLIDD